MVNRKLIDICLSPALYPYYKNEDNTVIVVDIFRATTTICAAFAAGATGVRPVKSLQEALKAKRRAKQSELNVMPTNAILRILEIRLLTIHPQNCRERH